MIIKKLFFKAGPAGFVCGAVLLVTLTGCVGYVDGPHAGVYVAPPVVEVGAQDDYVYYPGYDVYYNSNLHLYAYMDGGVWVSRPQPMGVSIDVLLASPSVRMDFHDSPANHNAEMARQYPRTWAPSGAAHVERAKVQRDQVERDPVQKAPVQRAEVQKAQVKKAPAQKENRKDVEHEEHEGK
jgi:hypothetical protein